MRWKKIRKFLPILGIGLFIYLLIKVDVTKIFQELKNVNLFYVSLAILFTGIFFVTQTLKWFVIARKQKIKVPFREALRMNLLSSFYGFITPSKVGSVIRIDYLKKYGDTGKGISNFVIDKVLDLSSLFILAIVFGFIFYKKIISSTSLYIILAVFFILILASLFFYKKEASKPFLKFVYKVLVPNRLKEKSKIMFGTFYDDMPPIIFLLGVAIINIINWIIDYAAIYFMGLSVGINLGFIPFLAILPISTLVAQIPITINGYGTRELTMISLFGLFGAEAVKVFSMSILNIAVTNILPSIFAILLLFRRERK